MALALPSAVISTFHSADPREIVQQATEHLQLDEDALRKPSADTIKKVQSLANLLKKKNRVDAIKQLRKIVPSGTTGLSFSLAPPSPLPHPLSLYVSLSVSLSVCLCSSFSVCLSSSLSVSLGLSLSSLLSPLSHTHTHTHTLGLYFFFCLCVSEHVCLTLSLCSVSVCLFFCLCLCVPFSVCLWLSVSPCFFLHITFVNLSNSQSVAVSHFSHSANKTVLVELKCF